MSGRPKYKMRAITGETKIKAKYADLFYNCWVLECGHTAQKHKPESLADGFRLMFQEMKRKDGETIKARCYECGKEIK